jgi:eukaryotic-like serine/threonine-protein kinase
MLDDTHSRLAQFRQGLARYTPIARLAQGGMGEVWRGEAHFPDGHVEEVAIKRVLPHLAGDVMYGRMLEDEARLGMLLKHRNIVRVFDARQQGSFIIVMEYVPGRSLRDVVERLRTLDARVPVGAAVHVAHAVAAGLCHAHEAIDEFGRELGLIHGDISPHNVLLGYDGAVKITDFGLARASANQSGRDPMRISGKYGYLAPEFVLRREPSQAMDLFALGVVMWECLSGRRLFMARSFSECRAVMRDCKVPALVDQRGLIPLELRELCVRLLARRPEDRPASARAVVEALELLMGHERPSYQRATVKLLELSLGKSSGIQPAVGRPQHPQRLSEAELEEFFASMATTVFTRPTQAPDNVQQLAEFIEECNTTLLPRP